MLASNMRPKQTTQPFICISPIKHMISGTYDDKSNQAFSSGRDHKNNLPIGFEDSMQHVREVLTNAHAGAKNSYWKNKGVVINSLIVNYQEIIHNKAPVKFDNLAEFEAFLKLYHLNI